MAILVEFKNAWHDKHTDAQKDRCAEFANAVLSCAKMAAVHMGGADFSSSGAHGLKAESRFFSDSPKAHRFYRASAGSTIERAVYQYLIAGFNGVEVQKNVYKSALSDLVFAFEFTGSLDGYFPCSFKNSRPDIRVSLGKGSDGIVYEVLFDLTSEKQQGHILGKGDNWVAKANIPYIAEVLWTDHDIMHKG